MLLRGLVPANLPRLDAAKPMSPSAATDAAKGAPRHADLMPKQEPQWPSDHLVRAAEDQVQTRAEVVPPLEPPKVATAVAASAVAAASIRHAAHFNLQELLLRYPRSKQLFTSLLAASSALLVSVVSPAVASVALAAGAVVVAGSALYLSASRAKTVAVAISKALQQGTTKVANIAKARAQEAVSAVKMGVHAVVHRVATAKDWLASVTRKGVTALFGKELGEQIVRLGHNLHQVVLLTGVTALRVVNRALHGLSAVLLWLQEVPGRLWRFLLALVRRVFAGKQAASGAGSSQRV